MELTEETKLIIGILGFMFTKCLWEYYLAFRQHKLFKTTTIPTPLDGVVTQETLDKSRLYTSEKIYLILLQDIFSILKSMIIIYYKCFHYFWELASGINPWDGEISTNCIWLVIYNTFLKLTTMPFIGYNTFIIEEKYGFNKQTLEFFIVDQIKLHILEEVVSVATAVLLINIVEITGHVFFLWLWLMIGTSIIIFDSFYLAYISPLFDDFTPLPQGELKTSIEALTSKLKFPLGQIYVLRCSKRSTHSNAYIAGLFGPKHIVLYDSLFGKGFTNEEILAVISHELGHWYHGHMTKILLFVEADLFVMLACFASMLSYAPLYAVLGFPATQKPILIGLIAIDSFVITPYHAFSDFLIMALTRSFEYQADAFAGGLGKAPDLISTLIRLYEDNLTFPVYDPLFSAWYFSHPTLLERISALSDTKKE